MGVGNSVVVNKTDKKLCVITFNYADLIYGSFEKIYTILPGESKNVETTVSNDKGLKIGVVYHTDQEEKEFLFQLWKVKNESTFTITSFNGTDITISGSNITSVGAQKTQGVKDEEAWQMAMDVLSVPSNLPPPPAPGTMNLPGSPAASSPQAYIPGPPPPPPGMAWC